MPDPKKAPVDTIAMKRSIALDKSVRANAIERRDANRADSSSNATVARLMAREGGVYGNQAADLRQSAAKQGAAARAADATVADAAKAIGARTDSLNAARVPKKYKSRAEWRKAMGME
jgi:hypothetical protein